MARIRTVKPEFFTSEDIVGLTPLARLLYIALWCESDKEGRMVWKPATFKLRYLPADNCDIKALCQELIDQGLVILYGSGYAYIPGFARHQHINPRESTSVIPAPDELGIDASRRVSTRANLDVDAQGGREGKGKERNEEHGGRAMRRCPASFDMTDELRAWAAREAPGIDADRETAKFKNHTFKTARQDWPATWQNWLMEAQDRLPRRPADVARATAPLDPRNLYVGLPPMTPDERARSDDARRLAMSAFKTSKAA